MRLRQRQPRAARASGAVPQHRAWTAADTVFGMTCWGLVGGFCGLG